MIPEEGQLAEPRRLQRIQTDGEELQERCKDCGRHFPLEGPNPFDFTKLSLYYDFLRSISFRGFPVPTAINHDDLCFQPKKAWPLTAPLSKAASHD